MREKELEGIEIEKNWIDAHAHLTDLRIEDVDHLMSESEAIGIRRFILGGIEPLEWERQFELQVRYPGRIHPVVGLHPWWVSGASENELSKAESALLKTLETRRGDIIALGETGLDFHPRFHEEVRPTQEGLFRTQLRLAIRFDLPLVLHVVRAHEEALAILREELKGTASRGIVHSFSGDPSIARAYLGFGLLPSISASVITRGKGKAYESLKRTLQALDGEEFVLETDLPDQSPAGEEGLNTPRSLERISRCIALFRYEKASDVLDRSQRVLERLFRL